MPVSEVHKRKRKKNFMVLGLLLLFCTAIFIVTMIKMARADEDINNAYLEERQKHQQEMGEAVKTWFRQYEQQAPARELTHNEMDQARKEHQGGIVVTGQQWDEDWQEAAPAREALAGKRDKERRDHVEKLVPRPEKWWVPWFERTTKDDMALD